MNKKQADIFIDFPSITIHTGYIMSDEKVITLKNLKKHCRDNQRILEAIEKIIPDMIDEGEDYAYTKYLKEDLKKELKLK